MGGVGGADGKERVDGDEKSECLEDIIDIGDCVCVCVCVRVCVDIDDNCDKDDADQAPERGDKDANEDNDDI